MTGKPNEAWVEAARVAAAKADEALGRMGEIELNLTVVSKCDAAATNSRDHSFLDALARGEHLNEEFLAHAQQ